MKKGTRILSPLQELLLMDFLPSALCAVTYIKVGSVGCRVVDCVQVGTLRRDGVLGAAGRVGLAAVTAGALQRVSAGAVDVQLEASSQHPGQLLVDLPVLLPGSTHTFSLLPSLTRLVGPVVTGWSGSFLD